MIRLFSSRPFDILPADPGNSPKSCTKGVFMRRSPAWVVAASVLALCAVSPGYVRADDGFWVTLAAGAGGATTPSDYAEFSFDSPHAPIVINQLTGAFTATATTGGGTTFFSGAGTPVLLPTTDGYATLAPTGGATPAAGVSKFGGSPMASGAPQVGPPPLPTGLNLLSVDRGEPGLNGSRIVTVGVTDANGNPLGQGQVTVPTDGWWVIGLGTASVTPSGPVDPPPGPTDPPPGPGDPPGSVDPPPTPPEPTGGTVTTPEPASALLIGVGGLATAGWRRLRRR